MKKTLKLAIIAILILAAMLCLTACDGLFSLPSGNSGGNKVKTGDDPVLTLALNGGTGVMPGDFISKNKLVEPANDPTRSGYVFDGYYLDDKYTTAVTFNVTISEDITIYVKWTPAATFVYGTWKDDVVVKEQDGKYAAPVTVVRTGYTFDKWYVDRNYTEEADFEADAVPGATFYAKYNAISYTISYNLDGLASLNINAKTTYTVEDEFNLRDPVSIEDGYVFVKWTDGSGATVTKIDKGSQGNKTFNAVFLSYNNFITNITGLLEINESTHTASAGVRYDQGDDYDVASKITVSPRATYVVMQGDDELTTTVDLAEGNNLFTVIVTSEAGETNTYALTIRRYTAGEKEVVFHYPDATSESRFVESGEYVTAPTPKEIAGYDFDDWYTTGYAAKFNFGIVITDDTDVYAKYTATPYTVTYYAGIGTNAAVTNYTEYNIERSISLTDAVAPAGYTSLGWYDGTGTHVTSISLGTTGNKTLYARYAVTTANDSLEGEYSASGMHIAKANILALFNWAVAARIANLSFTVTDDAFDLNNDMPDLDDITVPTSSLRANYSATGKNVTVTFTYVEPNQSAAAEDAYTQKGYNAHETYSQVRSNDFDNFKINSIYSTYTVSTTDQLIYVIESGYRPVPEVGSAAERVYNAAKAALRTIVDDNMTDVEKAHEIYDWLILNVVYDNDLLVLSASVTDNSIKEYNGFYLEGVFDDHRAVCDGISKAFVLMCGIEGIEAVQVSGTSKGSGHAWNKIKIDDEWFVVDPTHGGTILGDEEVLNHGFFMITDTERAKTATAADHTDLEANTTYDYYSHDGFVFNTINYDFVVTSRAELTIVLKYLKQLVDTYGEGQTIDVRMDYAYSSIATEIQDANVGTGIGAVSYSGGVNRGDVLILIK